MPSGLEFEMSKGRECEEGQRTGTCQENLLHKMTRLCAAVCFQTHDGRLLPPPQDGRLGRTCSEEG